MADHTDSGELKRDNQTNPYNSPRCPRTLTDDERIKLDKDTTLISDFKREKLEKEAVKNWDLFYKRNSTNFFKDRHWTTREFQELLCDHNQVRILSMHQGRGTKCKEIDVKNTAVA